MICLLGALLVAAPGSRYEYYALIFSYDDPITQSVQSAHTFATFVKVEAPRKVVELQTISWYPRSGTIRLLATPEAGVNRSLAETLQIARKHRLQTVLWGPYEIKQDLYVRAIERVRQLEQNQLQYRVLASNAYGAGDAVNCIHAVSDLCGSVHFAAAYGQNAGRQVALHCTRFLVQSFQTHDWLTRAVLHDCYPRGEPAPGYPSGKILAFDITAALGGDLTSVGRK